MSRFKLLSEFLNKNNIELTDIQEEQLITYYERLIDVNKVMNLTAITEFNEVEEKHFTDSLAIISFYDMNKVESLIDIGSGAGFPGLPIKIIFPHIKVVLADSLNKRVNFLNNTVKELKLSEISAVHGRAEELARDLQYREKFDLCVSRAVSRLSSLSELCLPFVKKDGSFIPYKSGDIDEEITEAKKAIKLLGGNIENIIEMSIGKSDLKRSFPIIKKINETPSAYPRKTGTPQKKPIR